MTSGKLFLNALGELSADPDPVKSDRVMKAMLQMKKIDIETLKEASKQG